MGHREQNEKLKQGRLLNNRERTEEREAALRLTAFLEGGQRDRLGDKESREGQTYQRDRPSNANNIWNVNEVH